jgi:lysophospholipase L1-like esterase
LSVASARANVPAFATRIVELVLGCALILAVPDPTMGQARSAGAETTDRSRIEHVSTEPATTSPPGPIVLLGASYARGWQLPPVAGRSIVNKGEGGQESWELLARFDRDVLALRPSAVIIWGTINDVFRAPRDRIDSALDRVRTSFEQMTAKAKGAGVEVIVATEVTIRANDDWREWAASWIGWVLGKTSYQDYVNGHVATLNAWLRNFADREGLLLLDLQPVVSDAGGQRRRGFAAEDGSHFTSAGYDALTAYATPVLERHFGQPGGNGRPR